MSPVWKHSVVTLAALLALSGSASAQVCGDADNNGQVSVTDGVQALRAAAGLPSSCTLGTCDVDGSSSITVTDGVNILRKAAALPITENCPGGGTDAQIESLLQSSLPLFGEMTKIGVGIGQSARAALEQQCDGGGSLFIDDQTGDIEFFDCTLGTLNYDGFFSFGANSFEFDITFTDLTTGATESLSGSLTQRQVGANFTISGFFDLTSDLGSFSVEFEELVTDQNGNFIGGSLAFSIEDAELPEVETIRMTFSPSNVAVVDVFLSDGSSLRFNFNLVTGELTPASS